MQGEADVAVAYNPTLPEWRNADRLWLDQKTVDLYEGFTNAHAAVVHITENFGPNFSKEFLRWSNPRASWCTPTPPRTN
jgi:hypothetical protein